MVRKKFFQKKSTHKGVPDGLFTTICFLPNISKARRREWTE